MASKIQFISSMLLIATCAMMMANFGLAQAPLPPPLSILPPFLTTPGLMPPGIGQECQSSLLNVQNCTVDGVKSIPNLQLGKIIGACCEAFVGVSDNCWAKIFPWDALFPQLVKNFCSIIGGKN